MKNSSALSHPIQRPLALASALFEGIGLAKIRLGRPVNVPIEACEYFDGVIGRQSVLNDVLHREIPILLATSAHERVFDEPAVVQRRREDADIDHWVGLLSPSAGLCYRSSIRAVKLHGRRGEHLTKRTDRCRVPSERKAKDASAAAE